MTETKKRRPIEIYEDYWSLTVGHTDYFDKDATSFKILKYFFEKSLSRKNIGTGDRFRSGGTWFELQRPRL